ncbi:MAG: ribosome biogenesis GTPase Der [Polyangiales bacterium]
MTRHQHSVPHRLDRIPASARARFTTRPIIAIVGRPNVGKSTLFNRLAGARLAIVHDEPGVTRDRHYADAFARGVEYSLIDTGGYDPDSDDPMRQGIARHVLAAIEEADVVVSVLDATVDLTGADREAVQLLRASKRPVLYAANKADSPNVDAFAYEFYSLGIDKLFPISALHGRGIAELEEAIIAAIPPPPDAVPDPFEGLDDVPRIALVGRPNAGKSSLLNRLAGEERSLVDDRPGTTRDTVDALVNVKIKTEDGGTREQPLVILDTAGIRKKAKVHETIEALSVMRAVRAIERAEVAVIMVDAIDGVAEQDAKIAGLAVDRGRAVVIALNKCDELDNKEQARAEELVREKLSFVPWAPIVRLSAKTGRGVGHLAEVVTKVRQQWCGRVTTGQVNRFFAEVLATHPPPTQSGRAVRLYFVTQAETRPPTFIVVTNHPDYVHFSYQRYILNQIRERFGFEGTPLKVRYREKRRRPKGQAGDKHEDDLAEVVLEQDLGSGEIHEVEGLDEREVERLARESAGQPVKRPARDDDADDDGDAIESDGADVGEEPTKERAPRGPRNVKPVVAAATKSTGKRMSKPSPKRATKPEEKRAERPSTKRSAKPSAKRSDKPSTERASKPAAKRSSRPSAERSTERAPKPTAKRSSKPSAERSSTPAAKRASKPTAKHSSKASGSRRR